MIKTHSRKARIAAAAVGATAIVGSGVFGINTAASAAAVAPVVSKLNVSKGSTAGGTVVTITGKNFTGATAVNFDAAGTPALGTGLLVLSDTQIAIVAPAGSTTGGQVAVTTPYGTSADVAADNFTFVAPMDSAAAASVLNPLGKSTFIVTSTGLGADAAAFKALKVTATVGGVTAPVAWASATTATVTAPAGTSSGTAASVVLYHDGVAGAADTTNALYAAVISGLSKTSGPLAGGSTITVTGKGLTGATLWFFGGVAATCTAVSVAKVDTSWTCTVPAGAAGPVSVKFTPAAGAYGTLAGATYTYVDVN
jgi:hypothetical protein